MKTYDRAEGVEHHGELMFLTEQEMRELTGYAQKAKQVGHLRKTGIPFYLNASGHPIVARAVIEGGRTGDRAAKPHWKPNFGA